MIWTMSYLSANKFALATVIGIIFRHALARADLRDSISSKKQRDKEEENINILKLVCT